MKTILTALSLSLSLVYNANADSIIWYDVDAALETKTIEYQSAEIVRADNSFSLVLDRYDGSSASIFACERDGTNVFCRSSNGDDFYGYMREGVYEECPPGKASGTIDEIMPPCKKLESPTKMLIMLHRNNQLIMVIDK